MKKSLLLFLSNSVFVFAFSQQPNWQNKDLKTDGIFGISTEKAYTELLQNKKYRKVLVAVIDGGIDTTHEDLKAVLWTNPKEIADNKKDDDHNGYPDDMHGWNFIGGAGGNVVYDNLEMTRLIRRDKNFYDSLSLTRIPVNYQAEYQAYRKMKRGFDQQSELAQKNAERFAKFKLLLEQMVKKINKDKPVFDDFKNYQPQSEDEKWMQDILLKNLKIDADYNEFKKLQIDDALEHYKELADYQLNLEYDPRSIVGDDYRNIRETRYGNNDVCGPSAEHGTHVAGIIAAIRNNNIGINGVADHVEIMSIRVVPKGDERDKDVANAIRYATDNGAKVINLSFGKAFSSDKKEVDEAVKYAMDKDVLIVHGAGNDGKNLDDPANYRYPNRIFSDSSGIAGAWIEVGASGSKDDSTLVAPFSNYGKKSVDVFAPGVQIYSTFPGSKYEYMDGTSMAAPIVTGLAALIREYYPKLTAGEVRDIIMKSVEKVNHAVMVNSGDVYPQMVKFSEICISGGIVNAYNALMLAARYN